MPLLVLCLLWVLFWYRDTATAMVTIWARSETFTHGFLILPISLWLIWRQRHVLARYTPQLGLPWLALAALAGFGWLLGELAAVNAVTQLALVALLVLAVPAVLGNRLAWAMAFPLGFLFFAVPVGEFLMPQFIDWTADFTVLALKATGIPVYREGNNFIIPSGSWSVVEACSGVRYLIASVTVGTLFAYLNYVSLRRRLIFVGVSILVPIVANWLRAYIIVMLGHLSGNKLAVGVDHLIYGWLFFGVVIMIMFIIGARWAEPAPAGQEATAPPPALPVSPPRLAAAAAAFCLVTLLPQLWLAGIERSDAAAPPTLTALSPPAGWQVGEERSIDWRPAFENPSAELQAEYGQGDRHVGLFIAYYRSQDYGRKLVTSTNVLVRSNDPTWTLVARGGREIVLASQAVHVRTAELRGEPRLVTWQWYWINGRWTSSDHLAKAYTALARLMGQGDDSAVVILYAPKDQPGGAEAALEAFARDAGTTIAQALQTARDTR
jgi:exosortase A